MVAFWYTLHVKPHKERFVYELLRSPERLQAFVTSDDSALVDIFFPVVRVKPKNPRAATIRPYFPGYLFVCADLEVLGDNAFSWIPGAHGLVRFGEIPVMVPEPLIRELKQRVVQIEEAGGLIFDALKPGDPVRIMTGPFTGYDAIFDSRIPGKERVQVLLAFLSRHPQRVHLDVTDLEKVKKP